MIPVFECNGSEYRGDLVGAPLFDLGTYLFYTVSPPTT